MHLLVFFPMVYETQMKKLEKTITQMMHLIVFFFSLFYFKRRTSSDVSRILVGPKMGRRNPAEGECYRSATNTRRGWGHLSPGGLVSWKVRVVTTASCRFNTSVIFKRHLSLIPI